MEHEEKWDEEGGFGDAPCMPPCEMFVFTKPNECDEVDTKQTGKNKKRRIVGEHRDNCNKIQLSEVPISGVWGCYAQNSCKGKRHPNGMPSDEKMGDKMGR